MLLCSGTDWQYVWPILSALLGGKLFKGEAHASLLPQAASAALASTRSATKR